MKTIRIILAMPLLALGTTLVVMVIYGFFSELKFDVMEYVFTLLIAGILLKLGLFVFPRRETNINETE